MRALVLAQAAPAFLFSGVAVALPDMGRELDLSAVELGLVETTFLASGTAFLLPAGRLADATGRRSLYRWSLVAFAALSLAVGCATAGWLVLLLRFVQGAASAAFSAAGPAVLVELVPPARRGRVFGAVMGAAYAGLALGPLIAGVIVRHVGWRGVFVAGAAAILLSAPPVWRTVGRRWLPPGRWTHGGSLVALVAGTCALVWAPAAPTRAGLAVALGAGAISLAAFVRWQLRVERPLLDLRELRSNQPLRHALVVQLLLYLNAYCSVFLASLFLQTTKSMAPETAGLVLATGALVMAVVAPFAGRLADRVDPHRVTIVGVAAVVASSALGASLDAGDGPLTVAAVLALQGLGFGCFSSPNLALIMGCLPPERGGAASALAAQSRGLGMFAGMAVTGIVLAAWFGAEPVAHAPERLAPAVRTAYAVLVASSALALGIAVAALRRRRA